MLRVSKGKVKPLPFLFIITTAIVLGASLRIPTTTAPTCIGLEEAGREEIALTNLRE